MLDSDNFIHQGLAGRGSHRKSTCLWMALHCISQMKAKKTVLVHDLENLLEWETTKPLAR